MNHVQSGTQKSSSVLVSMVIRVSLVIKEEHMLHYVGKGILLLLKNSSPWPFQLPMELL
jgi:hypothetical protein